MIFSNLSPVQDILDVPASLPKELEHVVLEDGAVPGAQGGVLLAVPGGILDPVLEVEPAHIGAHGVVIVKGQDGDFLFII